MSSLDMVLKRCCPSCCWMNQLYTESCPWIHKPIIKLFLKPLHLIRSKRPLASKGPMHVASFWRTGRLIVTYCATIRRWSSFAIMEFLVGFHSSPSASAALFMVSWYRRLHSAFLRWTMRSYSFPSSKWGLLFARNSRPLPVRAKITPLSNFPKWKKMKPSTSLVSGNQFFLLCGVCTAVTRLITHSIGLSVSMAKSPIVWWTFYPSESLGHALLPACQGHVHHKPTHE